MKLFFRLTILLMIVVSAAFSFVPQDELTASELRGRAIYRKGDGGQANEIKAILSSGGDALPAVNFPCANCHGVTGKGNKEGGIQTPPLNWDTLTARFTSGFSGRAREGYNETSLPRAISHGLDSSNRRLHPAMPLYRMNEAQMSDVMAYLKILGSERDVDPGISKERIKIGAALPLSGALAPLGADIRALLQTYFDEINERGGNYERRYELVVADSRGDAPGTLAATQQLLEKHHVFALLGSFAPTDDTATNAYLQQREVPLIGPVTLSPRVSKLPNPYVFYLLPTYYDQARALVDFVQSQRKNAHEKTRLAVFSANNATAQEALNGLQTQMQMYAMELVLEECFVAGKLPPDRVSQSLQHARPDFVFVFSQADDIKAIALQMQQAHYKQPLLTSMLMLGRTGFELPAEVAASLVIAYPAALPEENQLAEFSRLRRKSGVSAHSLAFQSIAFAAAETFIEAVQRNGRQLSRTSLIATLEQFRAYKPSTVPPLTFTRNRRVGALGAYIVRIDPVTKQYVPMTDWIVPQEKP